ncbi:CPBP family intramembrane glutamic endopeptidase [Acetobacterium woodii]|uniref:Putative CAAX amino terminal protease n=1 Tax=Acetobacterium woodii (strain ATCC 29683 / DSM 1030 / JCM 2381 / KCTC 1655 / WB1) TaxID=931626 RepID=H6LBP8_ACEWD|nr:type II CAAX endopeptidase family protein [Acetobacterium woodii]AFA50171.1 putative CAAX amino terminal protease [Acetobacterium woodii DSM 1030]
MNKTTRYTAAERKKMGTFLFYTFVIAWGTEFILIAAYHFALLSGIFGQFFHYAVIGLGAGMAPAYAALIVLKKENAITFRGFCKQIFYNVNLRRTVSFIIVFCLLQFMACAVQETYLGNPWYYFILFIPMMILGGGLEEIGWRGLLQPLLEKRFSFLVAAIVESIIWSIWHLPLWLVPDTTQGSMNFIAFTLYCMTLGCTLAAIHRLTKSIWASVLVHAWGNTVLGGMYTITTLINFPGIKTMVIDLIQIVLVFIIYKVFDSRRQHQMVKMSSFVKDMDKQEVR